MELKQISNILTHDFLSKCKNGFDFATDQSKSQKKHDKNIELVLLFGNTNLRNIFMQA